MSKLKKLFLDKYAHCRRSKPDKCKNTAIKGMRPLVFSADCIFGKDDAARCDQFVICDMQGGVTGIYLIENKGGSFRLEKIQKQFPRCADFIGKKLGGGKDFAFDPILVAKRNPFSREDLNRHRIVIGKTPRIIKHISPNDSLPKIEAEG